MRIQDKGTGLGSCTGEVHDKGPPLITYVQSKLFREKCTV